jgi:predicted dienelactone hydrolase
MRHQQTAYVLIALAFSLGTTAALAAEPKSPAEPQRWREAGPNQVEVATYQWTDAVRQREVPVKIYYPRSAQRCPVIIMSHGLGGSRDGYEYLGRHWASHGYVSVHPQHKGSDDEVWKGVPSPMESMQKAAANPANAMNRPKDVSFVIDRLEQLDREDGPLRGRLDTGRIGMAGHSFGGYTTLAIAGQVFPVLGQNLTLADRRIRAAVPMSGSVPKQRDKLDQAFGSIKIPCLHMTGTLDDSPIGETKAAERRLPFDHIHLADQYLVNFVGGDHMIFSGRPRRTENVVAPGWQGSGEKDPLFQELIRTVTAAFWDAYLKDDAQAKTWLTGGGCQAMLGENAQFEKKLK